MKSEKVCTLMLLLVTILFPSGCGLNGEDLEEQAAAYISAVHDSIYEQTFDDLNLGDLFVYDLKVNQADKRWVKVWLEGYRNGVKIEDFYLPQLNYGQSPREIDEGKLIFGIIEPHGENVSLLLRTSSVGSSLIQANEIFKDGHRMGSTANYAIGTEAIGLEMGETKILAGYRQLAKNYFRTYDFNDPDSLKKMIKEDKLVLLLKIKIEDQPNH